MVTRIDVPYNAILSSPLLNKLSTIMSPQYLLMKFKTDKGITFIRGYQVKARRRCMMVPRAIMKQLEVMILGTLKE